MDEDGLKAEAKRLNIRNAHTMSEDTLRQRVAEQLLSEQRHGAGGGAV